MAYPGAPAAGPNTSADLSKLLPYHTTLRDQRDVVLDRALLPGASASSGQAPLTGVVLSDATLESMRMLLNLEIAAGNTYPFLEPLDMKAFLGYYCAYDLFVLRLTGGRGAPQGGAAACSVRAPLTGGKEDGEMPDPTFVGCFYIKPNFPGRSNHICNAGFLVAPQFRNSGAGRIMGERFRHLGKALGYRGSMFNLVYRTNVASNVLWAKLGYVNIGVIPGAGRLRVSSRRASGAPLDATEAYVDALMWFFDMTVAHIQHLPAEWEVRHRVGSEEPPKSKL